MIAALADAAVIPIPASEVCERRDFRARGRLPVLLRFRLSMAPIQVPYAIPTDPSYLTLGRTNMDIWLLALKVCQSLQERRVGRALRGALRTLRPRGEIDEFDLHYGVSTSGDEPLWRLDIASPNARFGRRHQTTSEWELRAAIQFLGRDPARFTFIDLGCGKGRTLIAASRLGFRQSIGVEFARELADAARTNLVKLQIADASVLHCDAADFLFPAGNLVIYLYNPFTAPVMTKVVANLESRAHRPGDEIYVAYKEPQCAAILDSATFLKRLGTPPGVKHITVWKIGGTGTCIVPPARS
jgi:hypothetical protein